MGFQFEIYKIEFEMLIEYLVNDIQSAVRPFYRPELWTWWRWYQYQSTAIVCLTLVVI